MRTSKQLLGLGLLVLSLSASQVQAQGKGKGHDKDKGKDKDRDRDRVEVVHSNGDVRRVPPGLAKKPGGMPPGQYKKRYHANDGVVVIRELFPSRGYTIVRTVPAGTSQYVYYRGSDGLVRKAIISEGPERLSFSNVPASILQEILARLY